MKLEKETVQPTDIAILIGVSSIAAAIGAVFGVIAYYNQWLG